MPAWGADWASAPAAGQREDEAEHDADDGEDQAEGCQHRDRRQGGGEDHARQQVEEGGHELGHGIDGGLKGGWENGSGGPPMVETKGYTSGSRAGVGRTALEPGAGVAPATSGVLTRRASAPHSPDNNGMPQTERRILMTRMYSTSNTASTVKLSPSVALKNAGSCCIDPCAPRIQPAKEAEELFNQQRTEQRH